MERRSGAISGGRGDGTLPSGCLQEASGINLTLLPNRPLHLCVLTHIYTSTSVLFYILLLPFYLLGVELPSAPAQVDRTVRALMTQFLKPEARTGGEREEDGEGELKG